MHGPRFFLFHFFFIFNFFPEINHFYYFTSLRDLQDVENQYTQRDIELKTGTEKNSISPLSPCIIGLESMKLQI